MVYAIIRYKFTGIPAKYEASILPPIEYKHLPHLVLFKKYESKSLLTT